MPALPFQVSLYGGYTLALKRNLGHAAAQVTIEMMASELWQGALRSKDIVYKFEAKVGGDIKHYMLSFSRAVASTFQPQCA
jgi:hypothetical protein